MLLEIKIAFGVISILLKEGTQLGFGANTCYKAYTSCVRHGRTTLGLTKPQLNTQLVPVPAGSRPTDSNTAMQKS